MSAQLHPDDGRRARSDRSRSLIVAGYLDLVAETGAPPTMEDVARHAGLSVRTVYRLFPDHDTLISAVIADRFETLASVVRVKVPASAPRAERIAGLVARRAKAYEAVRKFRSVALAARHVHPGVAGLLADGVVGLRAQLEWLFAKELDRRSAAGRRDLLDALEMVTSWSAWDALREDQGLSVARARRVMESTALAVLAR